jgi:tRNA-specific 2-thiouridylase
MRALALFSGGLDSMIAVKLLTLQGIDVTALYIDVGFGSSDDKSELLKSRASMVGADFEKIDAKEQFVQDILFNPKYGYGKNFNPCIDCHANMFRIALSLLEKYDAKFVITGEVIGQRPMSQRVDAIKNVTKLAGDEESLILRPLSAKLMNPTKPELEGWVDREKLLGISGRNRDTQLKLAKEWGFSEFESPGGGCLLTEEAMAKKIKEHIKHDEFIVEDIDVLKVGRHLRLPNGAKLIIGRNKDDNEKIKKITNPKYTFARALDIPSPLCLINKDANEGDKLLASKLILTYTKAKKGKVKIADEEFIAEAFDSKEKAKEYFVLK